MAMGKNDESRNYVEDRVLAQQEWHSDKAAWNRRRFYATEAIALVVGAMIPVVNVIPALATTAATEACRGWLPLVNSLMGASIVIAVGSSKLWKFQENWLQYRGLAEALLTEKELFLEDAGDYQAIDDKAQKKVLLVDRVEDMLATDTRHFLSRQRPAPEFTETATEVADTGGPTVDEQRSR